MKIISDDPRKQRRRSAAIGALGWTLAEYALHRFSGHRKRGTDPFAREHRAHHADTRYYAPLAKKIGALVPATFLLGAALSPILSRPRAAGFSGGLFAGWAAYEWTHYAAHAFPPKTRYGRRIRKHHMSHHFAVPNDNFGVTTALWDRAFGTYRAVDKVRIPRRQAMSWLFDDAGDDVRPEHATDYELRGRRRARGG